MIWESSYWKDDLLKSAELFSKKEKQKVWPDRSLANIEKDLFLGFYAIRKLIESKKLSTSIETMEVKAVSYPLLGKNVNLLNRHRAYEFYDFSKKRRENISIRFMCNQVIHSYVFLLCFTRNSRLRSILICSDKEKKKRVFEINLKSIIRIFKIVGSDYPTKYQSKFNPELGDYEFFQS
jgi:hypothetical protein